MSKSGQQESVAVNRKARHNFKILDTIEAGICLAGTEVKSARLGKANIADAFAKIEKGEAWLYGCDIQPYAMGNVHNHLPRRPRKLLLHREEIDKLFAHANVKGRTLPALELYWKGDHLKLLIGIGEGKTHGDKRQSLKTEVAKREMDRAIKNRRS